MVTARASAVPVAPGGDAASDVLCSQEWDAIGWTGWSEAGHWLKRTKTTVERDPLKGSSLTLGPALGQARSRRRVQRYARGGGSREMRDGSVGNMNGPTAAVAPPLVAVTAT